MFRKILLSLALCFAAPAAFAAAGSSVQDFFSYPKISDVKISPDGKYLAFVIADPKTGEDRKGLVLITTDASRNVVNSFSVNGNQLVAQFWWTADDRILAATATQVGSYDRPFLDGNLYAINADGSKHRQLMPTTGQVQMLGGPARDNEMVYFFGLLWLDPNNPKHALVYGATRGLNVSYDQVNQVYDLDLYQGSMHRVILSPLSNGGFIVDNHGNIRVATGQDALTGKPKLLYRKDVDSHDWQDLSALLANLDEGNDEIGVVGFMDDDKRLYWLGRTATSTLGLYALDPDTLKLQELYSDPDTDINGLIWSYSWNYPKKIVAVETMPGLPALHVLEPDDPKVQNLANLYQSFEGQVVSITSNTADGSLMVLHVTSDTNPGDFYLFDAKSGKASYLFSSKPELDSKSIGPMQAIEFKARDGVTVHGYLTLPPSGAAKNLPLIINPHGGPHGIRDEWGFNAYFPEPQFFASHGYAVLQVNYRGSSGYGRNFQDLGYGHWATTMQDDLADAVQWAVKQGYADANRVCIYGASYGGYAALESSVRYPDMYKCTVGYVGVYDLALMDSSDFSHYASGKNYIGVTIGTNSDAIKADSPVYHVDKIKDPLFIIYGGHDKRVVPKNAEELMAALDKIGKPYQKLYEPNEMHGFYEPEHRYEVYTQILAFFDKYIGPDAGKDVAKH